MKNEGRIIEILTEMVRNQDVTNQCLEKVEQRLERVDQRLERMEHGLDKVQGEIHKLNAQTVENTRAIVKLANKMEDLLELDKRVKKLETAVFK